MIPVWTVKDKKLECTVPGHITQDGVEYKVGMTLYCGVWTLERTYLDDFGGVMGYVTVNGSLQKTCQPVSTFTASKQECTM